MSECPLESLTVKYFSKWLSFTVIKTLQPQQKNWFRKLENSLTKLVKIKNHLKFNETCISVNGMAHNNNQFSANYF